MSEVTVSYSLRVNGRDHEVDDAWIGESLLYVLRERLGLPGAKNACEQGECGSCSVLVDGALVCSCLVLAAAAVDREIVTVEGICRPDAATGALSDVQQAFVDEGAVQCGFCTPGLVMAVHDLLDRGADPRPTSRSARRSPATSAGARATGASWRPCGPPCVRASAATADAGPDCVDHVDRERRRTATPARRRRGGVGDERPPARRRSQGAGRVRLLRPTCGPRACCGARRCARRTRRPASVASTCRHALAIPGVRAVLTARDVPGASRLRPRAPPTSRCSPTTSCATTASRWRRSPPTIPRRPAGRAPPSSSTTRCSNRSSMPRSAIADGAAAPPRRQRVPPAGDPPRRPRGRGRVVVEGTYEIGMQDQAPSAPRRGWRSPPTTAASTCTSRPSGCTPTASQVAACARAARGEGAPAPWPASVARSARAKTSACRSTRACWPCTPADR